MWSSSLRGTGNNCGLLGMSLELRRMLQARHILAQFKLKSSQTRIFCTNATKPIDKNDRRSKKVESNVSKYNEMYQQLDKLDFMTAAKILFSESPKKKKFGIDFHLVQLFFACLPSLAVYLVAQYARHEMRKMDAELEKRNKKELEEKAKEMELKTQEEKAARSADLSEVQERLDKLEETVKQIVVEPKKQVGGKVKENQDCSEKKHPAQTTRSNTDSRSEPSKSPEKDHLSEKRSVEGTPGTVSTPISGASRQDQKQKSTDGATSKDQ